VFEYWVQITQEESQTVIRNFDSRNTKKRRLIPVTTARCLRVEPKWMYDNQELIGDLRLKDISLTGTHDASAFK
jgi:hypothetical protein